MRVRRVLAGSAPLPRPPACSTCGVGASLFARRCNVRRCFRLFVCLFVCLFLFACLRLYLFVCFLLLVTAARAWRGSGARESRVRSSEFSVTLSIDRFRCRCGRKTSPSPGAVPMRHATRLVPVQMWPDGDATSAPSCAAHRPVRLAGQKEPRIVAPCGQLDVAGRVVRPVWLPLPVSTLA